MLFVFLTILFVSAFIRTAFGFGEALVAVPLLALIMPIKLAAPIMALVSISVSVVALARDWRDMHFRSAGGLFVFTLAGIPLGLWLLAVAPEGAVKAILALAIIGFSAWLLPGSQALSLKSGKALPFFGLLAGVMGGAYSMNGPPIVAYATLRHWSPRQFRATLQGYFLPASSAVMAGYYFSGLWTTEVTRYFLLSLPALLLGILAGRRAHRLFNPRTFHISVHAGLIVVGLVLLWQSYS
jgi:uncharacterized membrane protein YfcA